MVDPQTHPATDAAGDADAPALRELLTAVECHRQGDVDQAQAIYRQVLKADPDQPDATHFLGLALYQLGRPTEALAHLERSLTLNPESADFHNNVASVMQDSADYKRAHRHAETAIRLRPAFPEAHNNLGCTLLGQGRPAEAAPHFQAAIAETDEFADAHNNLGAALQGLGRLDEAVACYRRALLLAPDNAEAWNNMGDALHALERINEAESAYRRAFELTPSDALRIKLALLLPTIYRSESEIASARARLSDEIDTLLRRGVRLSDPLREVNASTFLIAYQAENDRDLMARMARLFRPHLPELQAPARVVVPGPSRRVGLISSFWVITPLPLSAAVSYPGSRSAGSMSQSSSPARLPLETTCSTTRLSISLVCRLTWRQPGISSPIGAWTCCFTRISGWIRSPTSWPSPGWRRPSA